MLLWLGVTGCVKTVIETKNPKLPEHVKESKPKVKETITDSIGKMQGVADALGCIFAPEICEATKQEREMDR